MHNSTELALMKAYGKALRSLRTQKSYSQERLALEADLNRSHMFKLEAGLTNPTLATMMRICNVLGVPFRRFATELEKNLAAHTRKH